GRSEGLSTSHTVGTLPLWKYGADAHTPWSDWATYPPSVPRPQTRFASGWLESVGGCDDFCDSGKTYPAFASGYDIQSELPKLEGTFRPDAARSPRPGKLKKSELAGSVRTIASGTVYPDMPPRRASGRYPARWMYRGE